jgi:hypothetical protein
MQASRMFGNITLQDGAYRRVAAYSLLFNGLTAGLPIIAAFGVARLIRRPAWLSAVVSVLAATLGWFVGVVLLLGLG